MNFQIKQARATMGSFEFVVARGPERPVFEYSVFKFQVFDRRGAA